MKDGKIRFERLSLRDKLHLNRSGILAMGKHMKYAIHAVEERSPPPYSPQGLKAAENKLSFTPHPVINISNYLLSETVTKKLEIIKKKSTGNTKYCNTPSFILPFLLQLIGLR